ncbi:MAG TPA: hypothetical protein VM286_05340 [Candidatus Thermoplasmatota archaeon]|nr:hypothetical protein [Candidatus Thermoplasmatota archaeon]
MKLLALGLSMAMLLLPAAQATAEDLVAASALCAGPPCGYITPIVDMEFAAKQKCPGSPGSIDLSKCTPVPARDQSVEAKGTFRYYWKESEDLTYPPDAQQPVVVTFSGVSTNPKWLTFKVEPASITIDAVALMDPRNLVVDQSNPASPVVYYEYKQDITVTFTHSGDPDAAALQKVAAKKGLVELFLKAKSSASGTYFKEGFGVESFRFDGRSVADPSVVTRTMTQVDNGVTRTVTVTERPTQAAPAGLLAPMAGLALALLAMRRRTT